MLMVMPKRRRPAGQPDPLNRAKMRELREALGLTQDDAAERAGFSGGRSRWSEIETGKRRSGVTLDTLYAIAAALNCDPCDLLVKSER